MPRLLMPLVLLSLLPDCASVGAETKFELAIRGGRIVDGTGNPWYRADIGIQDGKIARIGHIAAENAKTVIDASGLFVAPGFIDLSGQTATRLLDDPKMASNLLSQGITTINIEEAAVAPLNQVEPATRGWSTLAEYVQLVELKGLPVNLVQTVGQTGAGADDVPAFDRGRIVAGIAADLIVFDDNAVTDIMTFADPSQVAERIRHVIVSGKLVVKDGKQTDELPGRVLRGPGYRAETASHAVSSGKLDARLDSFDRMMRAFIERHHVPGASLAVTDRGRVVLARGYGYADVATGEQVTTDSLFRIASLSKPITAVAILQLVERGKLRLDDKVFEVLDCESDIKSIGARFDTRQRDTTIRHLLEHRGGWDRDVSFDGMFRSVEFAVTRGLPAPAGPETVIRSMLEHSLDFDPGHRYAYSNYGYCLLGRVVEKLAGQSYEQYVQANVLAPLDIHAMRIGKTRLDQRQPHEVRYYYPGRGPSVFQEDLGREVPWPYGGWYLEAMDSHGAWIASATDLAKFAAAFDDPEHCKILSAASIATMFARPAGLAGHEEDGTEKAVFYSLGWFNRVVGEGQQNNWHTGSLAGTATILIRRHDGRNFVVLFNARGSSDASHFGREIDPRLHQAANEVREWPK